MSIALDSSLSLNPEKFNGGPSQGDFRQSAAAFQRVGEGQIPYTGSLNVQSKAGYGVKIGEVVRYLITSDPVFFISGSLRNPITTQHTYKIRPETAMLNTPRGTQGSFNDLQKLIKNTPWWGEQSFAQEWAQDTKDLFIPNPDTSLGPIFAYAEGSFSGYRYDYKNSTVIEFRGNLTTDVENFALIVPEPTTILGSLLLGSGLIWRKSKNKG